MHDAGTSGCEASVLNRTAWHYLPHVLSCIFLFSSLITPLPFVPCSVVLSPFLSIFALMFSIHCNVEARLPTSFDRILAFLTSLVMVHTLVSIVYFVLVHVVHSLSPSIAVDGAFHIVTALIVITVVSCTGFGLSPDLAEPRWELFCETFGLRKFADAWSSLGDAWSSLLAPLRDLVNALVGAATTFFGSYTSRTMAHVAGPTERTPLLDNPADTKQSSCRIVSPATSTSTRPPACPSLATTEPQQPPLDELPLYRP